MDEKIKGYTAVSAIQTAFSILQNGITDRENKTELRKLREAMERIESGGASDLIDVWLKNKYYIYRVFFKVKIDSKMLSLLFNIGSIICFLLLIWWLEDIG